MTATTTRLAVKHNFLAVPRYRSGYFSGLRFHACFEAVWMPLEKSAGRDWQGSCYATTRGYLSRCEGGGWLAIRSGDGSESMCELAARAEWFPTLLRAYSHVCPPEFRARHRAAHR